MVQHKSADQIANRLRELRKSKKLTQNDVAVYLGVDRSTYAYYENGSTKPSVSTLLRLSSFYGISVDFILSGDNLTTQIEAPNKQVTVESPFSLFEGGISNMECALLSKYRQLNDDEKKQLHLALNTLLNPEDT